MNAGAGGVTAALLISPRRDARLGSRLAGLNRSVIDADRATSTTAVPTTTVATTTADATVMTTGRRTEEPREPTRTTFGPATFRTTTFTHSGTAAIATAVPTTGVFRNASGQAGIEGGLAVGFDRAFSRLAGLEGLEARVDGSAGGLRVALGSDER